MREDKLFKKNLRELKKLMRKGKCQGFIGLGYVPICKEEYRARISDQLLKCLDYEPFAEYLRKEVGL